MKKLTPIPIPLKQRWQDFRLQAVPYLVGCGTLVGVAYLWTEQSAPPAVLGEVEALVSEIISPGSGTLVQLGVTRFQEVEAGAHLGTVITTPPDVLHASLAILKAEIELTRLGWIDPFLDQQRNALQLEALKLDWLEQRATLAIRRIELQQAERDYRRVQRLHENRMVSDDEYDRALSQMRVLEATVSQVETLAAAMEQSLERLKVGRDGDDFAPAALRATLALQEERLALQEAELRPMTLIAPISGTVMFIYRRNGEYVVEGEPILTIQSPHSERIVAYLRQPLTIDPAVGMTVEVAVRNGSRHYATSEIIHVGPQMELLGPVFLRPYVEHYQSGLPIAIRLPPELSLRPGELVDVSLRQ